jgi:hypothetical protein
MGAAYLKEYWSDGVMEFWKGIEKPKLLPIEGCITPILQYSSTPVLRAPILNNAQGLY